MEDDLIYESSDELLLELSIESSTESIEFISNNNINNNNNNSNNNNNNNNTDYDIDNDKTVSDDIIVDNSNIDHDIDHDNRAINNVPTLNKSINKNINKSINKRFNKHKHKHTKHCKHNRNHTEKKCPDKKCTENCTTKDCKYCKILSISPHHLGVQFLVANDLHSIRGDFKELYINDVRIKEPIVKRYNINDDPTNRKFYSSNLTSEIYLDKLVYRNNQSPIVGGMLKSICINNRQINDIIFNPTFYNKGNNDAQVSIYLLLAKICDNYVSYKKLSRTVNTIPSSREQTLYILYKGPVPLSDYDSGDIYLWFIVNSSEGTDSLGVINDVSNITITYNN